MSKNNSKSGNQRSVGYDPRAKDVVLPSYFGRYARNNSGYQQGEGYEAFLYGV